MIDPEDTEGFFEKPDECSGCDYPTTRLMPMDKREPVGSVPPSGRLVERFWLCELCFGTDISNARLYPRQYDIGSVRVMETICYVGNTILARIDQAQQVLRERQEDES